MSFYRISSRFPRSAFVNRLNLLLLSNRYQTNQFHSLLNLHNKVVTRQVSPLHCLGLNSPVFQQFGFSSSTVSESDDKEKSSLEKEGDNTETKEAAAEASSAEAKVAEQKEEFSSDRSEDTEEELTMEDLIKIVTEKEELLMVKHKELEQMQEKVLRTYAEMENVMDRTRREAENSKKFAIQSFAKHLLDVADNLSRAASVVKESFSKIDTSKNSAGAAPLLKTILEGVEMTEKQLTENMDYIMLVCNYGGERLAVESETCRTFESLIERIGEKWSDLHHEELNLFYSTPQLDRFLLKDTVDYSAMLKMASIFNMKYIEIEVKAPLANKCPMSANSLRSKNKLAIVGDDMATASSGVNSHMPVVVHSSTETPLLSAYWGMGISNVGQKFLGGRFEFRAVVVKYTINRGFDVSYTRNDKKYMMACCKSVFVNPDSACPWYVSASACLHNKNYFLIRKFVNYHTCEARLKRDSSKQLSSKLVAGLITKPMSVSNKQWHFNDVIDHLKNNYGQDIDYKKAWSALDAAKEKLLGSDANSYQQLW